MSTPTTPITVISTAQTWLQKHEKIIIATLTLLVVLFLGNKFLDSRASHDKSKTAAALQQLTEERNKDAQLAQQTAQIASQYQAIVSQLSQQNQKLAAAMGNRVVVLQQQQATDQTMPLTDLENRWAKLVRIAPTDLSATPTGVNVSDTGARQTVEELEKIPVLTANLKDETAVADNRQQELSSANSLIDGLNLQVSSLNTTINTEETTCKVEIKSANATANKAKAKWFKIGFVAGFISGLFVGHGI